MLKIIEMKKSEMVDMYLYSSTYKAHPSHNKDIKYVVNFAKKKLEPDATALLETFSPSDEYIKYEAEKRAIVNEYAKKDENGNPEEIKEGVFRMEKEEAKIAKAKIEELDIQNKAIIAERTKDLIAFDKKLEEKIEIELEVLMYDSIPDDVDDDLMAVLFPIICKE